MTTSNSPQREELSLLELSQQIKRAINKSFPANYWVRAETSDVRLNASGHCYLELIEKSERTGQLAAKVRASIWASAFRQIKPYFEQATGQPFVSGIKVLVKVTIDYHELYGFSLNILNIDPAYTVGDMIRKRNEIIQRLQAEGIFTMNKELPFPALPKRIAVITSQTAAGYGDFTNQLEGHPAGYAFYCQLFPAVMQGEKAEQSIIAALGLIPHDSFDTVAIIRGGGAASELSCFDAYELAAHCAQFPLPIITGIGHERDETVLDLVAHTRLKTPTAVAEFLINCMDSAANELNLLQQNVLVLPSNLLLREKKSLQVLAARLPSITLARIERNRTFLQTIGGRLPISAANTMNKRNNKLLNLQSVIQQTALNKLAAQNHFLELTEQFIKMASPAYNLKRGYSLTLKNGTIVKRATVFTSGDEMTTRFLDGEVKSRVQ